MRLVDKMGTALMALSVVCGLLLGKIVVDHAEQGGEVQYEEQVEAAPFHGNFVCEYYGAKTQQIEQVVKYNVFDLGNNLGWSLTLADGAQLMYVQSADKFCYTVPTKVPPTK